MRARNIKPGVFKNEDLGVRDPMLTLLFMGLWCLADREGRLEDRPLRIGAEVFPYRNVDYPLINGGLTELASLDLIQRYEVDGIKIIQVKKFKKHQSPHKSERASTLPEYRPEAVVNQGVAELTVDAPLINGGFTVQAPSDSPNPDSPNPDSHYGAESAPATKKKKGTRITENWYPQEKTIKFFHATLPGDDLILRVREFVNYWMNATKAAIKSDWDRAFENRCIQIKEWKDGKGKGTDKTESGNADSTGELRGRIKGNRI